MPPNVGIGLDSKDDDAGLDCCCCCCCDLGVNNGAMRTDADDEFLGIVVFDAGMLPPVLASTFLSPSLTVISSFGKSSSISICVDCF